MTEHNNIIIEVTTDKEWDKEVITHFINEKDLEYDFGFDRIISLHQSLASIRGKGDDEKSAIVGPYVDAFYLSHQLDIDNAKIAMGGIWEPIAENLFVELQKIFGTLDFYKANKIRAVVSITKAGVIGEDNASFQIWYKTSQEPAEVRRHFAHEILHFFYYSYLREKGFSVLASDWNKAEIFNVVILTLPQFVSLIGKADQGYQQHEKYIPQYKKMWEKSAGLDDYLLKSQTI